MKYQQFQEAVNVLESILFTRRQEQKIHRYKERLNEFKIGKKITEHKLNIFISIEYGSSKCSSYVLVC